MKNYLLAIFILLTSLLNSLVYSQADNEEDLLGLPGDNLDLYAVLDLFQKSKTIEDFEKSLNGEETGINNLDLNLDNEIDFIKVETEQKKDDFSFILQVDVAEKETQDVAVILLSKDKDDKVTLQIVGDKDLYGKDYVVEPKPATAAVTPNPAYAGTEPVTEVVVASTTVVVVESAPVVVYVYSPVYVPYYPPYYYGYYPPYYRSVAVISVGIYRHNHYHHHHGYHGGHHGGHNTVVVHNTNNYNKYNNHRNSSNTVNHNNANGNYKNNGTKPSNGSGNKPSTQPSNPSASTQPSKQGASTRQSNPSASTTQSKPSTSTGQSSRSSSTRQTSGSYSGGGRSGGGSSSGGGGRAGRR